MNCAVFINTGRTDCSVHCRYRRHRGGGGERGRNSRRGRYCFRGGRGGYGGRGKGGRCRDDGTRGTRRRFYARPIVHGIDETGSAFGMASLDTAHVARDGRIMLRIATMLGTRVATRVVMPQTRDRVIVVVLAHCRTVVRIAPRNRNTLLATFMCVGGDGSAVADTVVSLVAAACVGDANVVIPVMVDHVMAGTKNGHVENDGALCIRPLSSVRMFCALGLFCVG